MAQGGDHPGEHQQVVVAGHRTQQVADDEHAHQRNQRRFARQARGGQGHERRADGHAQGVTGDQPAGAGNRYTQVCRHIGQQTHDDELGGTDGEGAERQDYQRKGHCKVLVRALGSSA
ncbi:hypothetical protein D9M71_609980 [compost metagenome]